MSRKLAIMASVCAFLLAAIISAAVKHAQVAYPQAPMPHIEGWGLVTQVIDGDTVVVDNKRIRLVGINAPEFYPVPEPGAIDAMQFLEELCLGKEVGLDIDDLRPRDKYGRTLAVVYVNADNSWVNLNAELLRRGYAEVLHLPPSEFNPYRWI